MRMKNVLLSHLVYEHVKTFNVFFFFGRKENFITKKRNNNNTVWAASTKMRLAKLGGLNPRSKEPKNK